MHEVELKDTELKGDDALAMEIFRAMDLSFEAPKSEKVFLFINGEHRPFICSGIPDEVLSGGWGGFSNYSYQYLHPSDKMSLIQAVDKLKHLAPQSYVGAVTFYKPSIWWKHLNMEEVTE